MLNSLNIKQYKPQSADTNIEADIIFFALLRKLSNLEKAKKTRQFNRSIKQLILTNINYQYPGASLNKVRAEYIKRCLGKEWIKILNSYPIEKNIMIEDPITLAKRIANILESLTIPYLVGGSVASSLWGESRATQDLDLVVNISVAQASAFIQAIQSDFYISEALSLIYAIQSQRISLSFATPSHSRTKRRGCY